MAVKKLSFIRLLSYTLYVEKSRKNYLLFFLLFRIFRRHKHVGRGFLFPERLRAVGSQKNNRRLKDELDVPENAELFDIHHIHDQLVPRRGIVFSRDLGIPGKSRLHAQPVPELRQLLCIIFDILDHLRTRSDKSHVPLQDIQKLGQFIDPCPPQEFPRLRDPVVIFCGRIVLYVLTHRTELVYIEPPAVDRRPLLLKEHRASVVKLHGKRAEDPERRRKDPKHQGQEDVKETFDDPLFHRKSLDILIEQIHIIQHIMRGVDLHDVFQIGIKIYIRLILIAEPHDKQTFLRRHVIHEHGFRVPDIFLDRLYAAAVIKHGRDPVLLAEPADRKRDHIQAFLTGRDDAAFLRLVYHKEQGVPGIHKSNNDDELHEKRHRQKLQPPEPELLDIRIRAHDHNLKICDDIRTDCRKRERVNDRFALAAPHVIGAVHRQEQQAHDGKSEDRDTHRSRQPAQTDVLVPLDNDKCSQK